MEDRVANRAEELFMVQPIGLPAILDASTETLILGSFPGVESLVQQRYYANPKNQFWTILGRVFGVDLVAKTYDDRLMEMRQARIGLWDVYASCQRVGSLDSAIRDATLNDFSALRREAPRLRRIAFNGGKAGAHASLFRESFEVCTLASSSHAYCAISLEEKTRRWRETLLKTL